MVYLDTNVFVYAGIEQDLARKDKIFDQDFKKMQGHTHIEIEILS